MAAAIEETLTMSTSELKESQEHSYGRYWSIVAVVVLFLGWCAWRMVLKVACSVTEGSLREGGKDDPRQHMAIGETASCPRWYND